MGYEKLLRADVILVPIGAGISSVQSSGLLDRITGAWENPAKPLAREGAVLAFAALVKQLGEAGEPYLLPLVPKLLERYADKVQTEAAATMLAAGKPLMVQHMSRTVLWHAVSMP